MRMSNSVLFEKAYGRFAIGAFNVFTLEQVLGLFQGASKCLAPIIVVITPAARRYAQPTMLHAMIDAAARIYPQVVFAVHLDHGDVAHCHDAIESAYYESVMIDASAESFERNIQITTDIVEKARRKNIHVEAELGVLGGVEQEKNIAPEDVLFTEADQFREFATRTGCDSLAIAIGTSHGAYNYSCERGLCFDILEKI